MPYLNQTSKIEITKAMTTPMRRLRKKLPPNSSMLTSTVSLAAFPVDRSIPSAFSIGLRIAWARTGNNIAQTGQKKFGKISKNEKEIKLIEETLALPRGLAEALLINDLGSIRGTILPRKCLI